MKAILIFVLFSFSVAAVSAQAPPIDSLKKVLASAKEDTVKVNALCRLSFYEPGFQKGLEEAEQGLELARKIKYEKGEGNCLNQVGNEYMTRSNFPIALHYYLEALKIRERLNDLRGMAGSYSNVGYIYQEQGSYQQAIYYYKLAESKFTEDRYFLAVLYQDMGSTYELLGQTDSSLTCYQRSYELFNSSTDKFQLDVTLNGLGDLQFKMGNTDLALAYYRQAIKNAVAYKDTFALSDSYLGLAKLYNAGQQFDSSVSFAKQSLYYSQTSNVLRDIIEAGNLLSALYKNNNDKEALRYLQMSQDASDSLYSRERTNEIQNMSLSESEREKEAAEKLKLDEEYRKQNIQYALIALGIVTIIIFYLLLSRSFITNTKLIEFFGIIALLIVFEFLNLLLHPFLEKITNQSPLLMLLVLVCIAALLVPVHRKIEKWAIARLVEKNKKIRLAAARKTIQQLDSPT